MTERKKIALFAGDGLISHATVSPLLVKICHLGFQPILFRTGSSSSDKANIPEFNFIKFFENDLLKDTVIPYINNNSLIRDVDGNLGKAICYSYEQLSDYLGFKVVDVSDINDSGFISSLMNDQSLVGAISIRNYQIFKSDIIEVFENKGFLWNLHTGQLPKYRGVFIPYRVIQNNDHSFGWTLHCVDRGIDTGNIIASTFLPLDPHDPVLDSYMGMVDHGVALIEKALLAYKKHGVLPGQEQPKGIKSYYTFPTSEEMQSFKSLGVQYISSPKAVIDTYVSNFSLEGTDHAYGLTLDLISAIADWQKGGTKDFFTKVRQSHAA